MNGRELSVFFRGRMHEEVQCRACRITARREGVNIKYKSLGTWLVASGVLLPQKYKRGTDAVVSFTWKA
jgi:hypothetical protein